MQTRLTGRLGVTDRSLQGAPLQTRRNAVTSKCRRYSLPTTSIAEFTDKKSSPSNGNGAQAANLEQDKAGIGSDILRKANYVVGKEDLDTQTAYRATALSVREHLIDSFNKTQKYWK